MTRKTRTVAEVQCDLCHVTQDDEGNPTMELVVVPERSQCIDRQHDTRDLDICEFCKSKLLSLWKAYCR